MTEIRKSYCGLCHPRCGTLLRVEDGRIVKVTGDPDHPVTRGIICERGRLMPDHVHHPQRLNRSTVILPPSVSIPAFLRSSSSILALIKLPATHMRFCSVLSGLL